LNHIQVVLPCNRGACVSVRVRGRGKGCAAVEHRIHTQTHLSHTYTHKLFAPTHTAYTNAHFFFSCTTKTSAVAGDSATCCRQECARTRTRERERARTSDTGEHETRTQGKDMGSRGSAHTHTQRMHARTPSKESTRRAEDSNRESNVRRYIHVCVRVLFIYLVF
jgi:hypothetical protein